MSMKTFRTFAEEIETTLATTIKEILNSDQLEEELATKPAHSATVKKFKNALAKASPNKRRAAYAVINAIHSAMQPKNDLNLDTMPPRLSDHNR